MHPAKSNEFKVWDIKTFLDKSREIGLESEWQEDDYIMARDPKTYLEFKDAKFALQIEIKKYFSNSKIHSKL